MNHSTNNLLLPPPGFMSLVRGPPHGRDGRPYGGPCVPPRPGPPVRALGPQALEAFPPPPPEDRHRRAAHSAPGAGGNPEGGLSHGSGYCLDGGREFPASFRLQSQSSFPLSPGRRRWALRESRDRSGPLSRSLRSVLPI